MNDLIPIIAASPLRQRLIDDMTMRRFSRETQRNYIRDVGRFATWLGRSPHTTMAEDLRRFQIEQQEAGVPVPTMNSIVAALRFFFTHTRLSVALHPPGRHLEQPAPPVRRAGRHLPLQGLSPRRRRPPAGHDALPRRVYPSLPAPRPAARVPSDPSLRPARSGHPQGSSRARPPTARGRANHQGRDACRTARYPTAVSVLRRPHGHRRAPPAPVSTARPAIRRPHTQETSVVIRHGSFLTAAVATSLLGTERAAQTPPISGRRLPKIGPSAFKQPHPQPKSGRSALKSVRICAASISWNRRATSKSP